MKLAVALLSMVAATKVTPTEKVVQLLSGMVAKGKEEKHAEQVQFAAYKQFCEDTTTEKTRAISEANAKMEKLEADIAKYTSDAKKLGREIADHEKNIATFEGDKAAATKVRAIEKADYDKTHKDYSESIDALGRAIQTLKDQNYDRKQAAAALLQVRAFIPKANQNMLDIFLQQPETSYEKAPEANAYEFRSSGIVDMMEKLEDQFSDERSSLEKKEVNAKNAFDLLMQDLSAQIESNTQAASEKSAEKAKKLQAAADAKTDLVDTTANRDADQAYLDKLVATCEVKASDFEKRQQLRADELQAIQTAIEILSSDDVAGAAKKHLPTMMQTSFVQLKSSGAMSAPEMSQFKAVEFLKMRAGQLNSKVLTQIAQAAGSDPFKKVKKLIQDLITRLMEEANAEAEQKGWCDTELATNEATRKEKTTKVEQLHADIDQLEASIAKLTEEIANLEAGVAALDEAMAKATSQRTDEKKENEATIADAKAAQTAVAQATQVLKEFYAKAGDATSFIQQEPAIFDSPYKGMQSENGGVIGMLEVIMTDFARLESETTAEESASQKEYDEFMDDSKTDKAIKNKDIEHKTTKKQNESQALSDAKGDLDGTQKELDAALAYFDKLKPTCIDSGVSYEDRVKAREEEIQSLQEALEILENN